MSGAHTDALVRRDALVPLDASAPSDASALSDASAPLDTRTPKSALRDRLFGIIGNGQGFLGLGLSCDPGYELDSWLPIYCVKKCKPGYDPKSFLCWSSCKYVQDRGVNEDGSAGALRYNADGTPILKYVDDDWRDTGLLCQKRLYDRGVGTLPNACADGNREMFVSMCYTKCPSGLKATTWSPATCSQECPPNTNEGGFANCTKVNSYGRGAGNWGDGCPDGYANFGLWCFKFWGFKFSGYQCPQRTCEKFWYASDAAETRGSKARPQDEDPPPYYYKSPFYWTCPPSTNAFYQKPDDLAGAADSGGGIRDWSGTCTRRNFARWPAKARGTCTADAVASGACTPNDSYNTRRYERNDRDCEENWGTLCYPKCDFGYNNFACCVCSPSCGALDDHGATCHRSWSNRGVGKVPDGCKDDDRIFTEGLCYKKCDDGYKSFCTTCTREGCPYDGKGEAPLTCEKQSYLRDTRAAVPYVADKINEKLNIPKLASGIRRIVLNALVIAACLAGAFLLLGTNLWLRSRQRTLHVRRV